MKKARAEEFDLEHFLPYRLSVLTNIISQGLAAGYREQFGISITEWRILAVLGRYPGLTASEVVERTAMDKVSISRAVKAMMHNDLLRRETDPDDRRRQRLFLTARKGQSILQAVVPRAIRFESELLQALTPTERRALDTIIDKLARQASRSEG